jgi:hypothetical protein
MSKSLNFTNLNDEADRAEETAKPAIPPQTRSVKKDRNNNYSIEPPPIPPRTSHLKQSTKPKEKESSKPAKPQAPKIQYLAGSLADDCYVFEETGDDCVYQITYKKVFNKNINADNNSVSSPSSSLTKNYSDYRLSSQATANAFKMLLSVSSSSSNLPSVANDEQNSSNSSSASTGLVYTRVKVKQLKYASLKKFVEHLTSEETGELDSSLVQTFLATYRTFSDTRTVLDAIRARYEKILPASLDMTEDVRVENIRSFRSLIKMWLDNYSEDFNEPPDFTNLAVLTAFVAKHMPETELGQMIEAKLAQFKVDNAALSDPANTTRPYGGHFLKNNKSFSHQRQHSHHHLQHHNPPTASVDPAATTTAESSSNVSNVSAKTGVQHHRRSYSNFTELSNTNSSSINNVGNRSSATSATTDNSSLASSNSKLKGNFVEKNFHYYRIRTKIEQKPISRDKFISTFRSTCDHLSRKNYIKQNEQSNKCY